MFFLTVVVGWLSPLRGSNNKLSAIWENREVIAAKHNQHEQDRVWR